MIPLTRPPKSTTKIAMSEIVQAVAEASGGIRSGVYKSAPPTGHEGASLPHGAAAGSRSGRFHPGGGNLCASGGKAPHVRNGSHGNDHDVRLGSPEGLLSAEKLTITRVY